MTRFLRHVGTIWRKEVRDNSRDRRTVLTTLLLGPMFGPLLLGALINFTVTDQIDAANEDFRVTVVGAAHAPGLLRYLDRRGISADTDHAITDYPGAATAVRNREADMVLLLEPEHGDNLAMEVSANVGLVYDQANREAGPRVNRLRSLLQAYSREIGALRLIARGLQPGIQDALIVDNLDVSTARGRSALLLGISTYFLLLAPLMGGLYLAIDTTAGERERKSLEPLLSLPISRAAILTGKLCATVTYMAASLVLAILSFRVAISFLPLAELGMDSSLSIRDLGLALLITAPFLPLGAALMSLVASFSRSYKEAQSYVSLMIIVPTLPLVFATLMNIRPAAEMMLIPSLSQHLLLGSLLRSEPIDLTLLGLSVAATLAWSVLVVAAAIRVFKREAFIS